MVKSKDKGSRWEKDATEILNEKYEFTWKKIVGSGAFGALLDIPELQGDLLGKYYFLPFAFRADAKTGYGGATQLTIKRDWFDKIRKEAEATGKPEVPCLICKFSGSRSDIKYFIALDFEAFHDFLEAVDDLYHENIRLREKWEKFAHGEDF